MDFKKYIDIACSTLEKLINTKSFSKEEQGVADIIEHVFTKLNYQVNRKGNNVWVYNRKFTKGKKLILLNSHLDTVKDSSSWTKKPFEALHENGKLYGLGSNDAGASLVSLMACFLALEATPQAYNYVFVASAEEEISGANGFESIQHLIKEIHLGIVGEPTLMKMAIAEKGLMVLDCYTYGVSGHAARNEGVNAISLAMKNMEWIHNYKFEKVSQHLGEVKMSLTQINAGSQHNVVPDSCHFVVDVRVNDHYTNKEIYDIISDKLEARLVARSLRMNSSSISLEHAIVKKGRENNMDYYASPTTSDQAIMKGFPTLKLGPGDSARSHTADEFVFLYEIENGIKGYYELLNNLIL